MQIKFQAKYADKSSCCAFPLLIIQALLKDQANLTCLKLDCQLPQGLPFRQDFFIILLQNSMFGFKRLPQGLPSSPNIFSKVLLGKTNYSICKSSKPRKLMENEIKTDNEISLYLK